LFGRRDPDDFYSHNDIKLLETLTNQTAIALTNIDQARRLHTLYQSNIDWHEEERKALARELHDDVLSQMATISLHTSSMQSPEFQESFSRVITSLRQMITSLRPAMLAYSLWSALDESIDGYSDHVSDGTSIRLEIPKSDIRYDTKVEEHLYRIAQQACENALRHSKATLIRVHGYLEPEQVRIEIEDNGVGLNMERMDFKALLSERHFGLAGMFERADLIRARLSVDSNEGMGTKVCIEWTSSESDQKE
jgi:signal transduction histidine kinase